MEICVAASNQIVEGRLQVTEDRGERFLRLRGQRKTVNVEAGAVPQAVQYLEVATGRAYLSVNGMDRPQACGATVAVGERMNLKEAEQQHDSSQAGWMMRRWVGQQAFHQAVEHVWR